MDSEDKCYSEGYNAYYNGFTLSQNPYKRFTPEWEQWRYGNNDSKKDNPYWETVKRLQRNAKRK